MSGSAREGVGRFDAAWGFGEGVRRWPLWFDLEGVYGFVRTGWDVLARGILGLASSFRGETGLKAASGVLQV